MRTAKSLCGVLVLLVLGTCLMMAPAVTPVSRADQWMLSGGGNRYCQGTTYECPDPVYNKVGCGEYGMMCHECKATTVPYTTCRHTNNILHDCGITKFKDTWCGAKFSGAPDKITKCAGKCGGLPSPCGKQIPDTFSASPTPCTP